MPAPVIKQHPAAKSSDPVPLKVIPLGNPKVRSKLQFSVVTAKVVETAGKKHVVNKTATIVGFLSVT